MKVRSFVIDNSLKNTEIYADKLIFNMVILFTGSTDSAQLNSSNNILWPSLHTSAKRSHYSANSIIKALV